MNFRSDVDKAKQAFRFALQLRDFSADKAENLPQILDIHLAVSHNISIFQLLGVQIHLAAHISQDHPQIRSPRTDSTSKKWMVYSMVAGSAVDSSRLETVTL